MNDLLTPPGERDLPPQRAMEMRVELMAAVRGPRARPTRRWLVAAVSATAVVAAVAGVALIHQVRDGGTQVLAMGPGELSPELKRGAEQCLKWHAQQSAPPNGATPGEAEEAGVPVSMNDIAVASRQGDTTAILFLNNIGYLGCNVTEAFGREITGGFGTRRWQHRDWLPGPVQRLDLSSTEDDGGDITVLGRVSSRVHRLVLERGNGKSTTARLYRGAFGILTTTDDVQKDAELVSYDAAGNEIDRRPLFQSSESLEHCYTDPAGKVIYGEPGPDCLPADPWKH